MIGINCDQVTFDSFHLNNFERMSENQRAEEKKKKPMKIPTETSAIYMQNKF